METTHLYHIGKMIKDYRKYIGISQLKLAEKVGLKQPDIAEIEAGGRNISINTLVKIGNALNSSISIELIPDQ